MSKLRQKLDTSINETDLAAPPEGDLAGWVIFTQLKIDGPFIYAGWLDAADEAMALQLAVNHYGRDQMCTAIWAAPREFIGGLRENLDRAIESVSEPREYRIFTQQNSGDQYFSSITVTADSAANAIEQARQKIEGAADLHNIWAIPVDRIFETDEAMLIWKNVDQSYRLARGYSKDVRQKWETIREERDLKEYERDDLKDTF